MKFCFVLFQCVCMYAFVDLGLRYTRCFSFLAKKGRKNTHKERDETPQKLNTSSFINTLIEHLFFTNL